MREAYRLHYKNIFDFSNTCEKQLLLFFIFIGKEKLEYATIEKNMQVVLRKIKKNIIISPPQKKELWSQELRS